MATAADLLIKVGADISDADSKIDQIDKKMTGFAGGIGGLAKTAGVAFLGLTGLATAGFGVAVNKAGDFQHEMSAVGSIAGATADQMAGLSQVALQLGQDNTLAGVGASDAAKAMQELAAGGVSVADIMGGAARGALLLASAGGLDVASAASIAANTMNAFGLAGTDVTHIADLLAAAANASSADVADLGDSMKYVAPVAKSMGLSVEETTAVLAELGAQGIKGSQAGTTLRSMLVSLSNPSQKAAGVISDLGLQFFDAQGHMKNFAGISEELHTKLAGLTDQQRASALATIFGNEALSGATILYDQGAAGVQSYLEKVDQAGSAAANGAARNDNLTGSLQALGGAVETAEIAFGTAFLPVIRSVVDVMADAVSAAIPLISAYGPKMASAIESGLGAAANTVRAFATAVPSLFNAIRTGDFNSAFGPLLVAIDTAFGPATMVKVGNFVSGVLHGMQLARDAVITAKQAFAGNWVSADSIATPVRLIGEAFSVLGNVVRALQNPMTTLNTQLLRLGLAFPPLLGPATAVMGTLNRFGPQIAAVVAGFVAFGPALRIAAVALPALIAPLGSLMSIVRIATATFPVLGAVIGAIGLPITIAIAAIAGLAIAWQTNLFGIRDITMPIIQQIAAFFTGTLVPAFQQAWTMLQTGAQAALTAVMPLVQQFIGFLQGQLLPGIQGIIAVAVPAFAQMRDAVVSAFQAALPGIQAFISGMTALGAAVLPIIAQVAGVIIDSLGPAVMAIVDWAQVVIPQFAAAFENVMGIVGPIVGELASLIGSALSAIAGFISDHSAQITAILTDAWGIISNVIGAAMSLVSGLISAGLQLISGDWQGAWQTIQQTAADVWDHIQSAISSAVDLVKNVIEVGLAAAADLARAAWDKIVSTAQTAMSNLQTAISSGINSALAIISALPGQILGALGNLGGLLFGAGQSLIQGLINGIDSMVGAAISKVQGLAGDITGAISGALGIHSPSRVFYDIGQQTMLGMVLGMDEEGQNAVKKAADIAKGVAEALKAGVEAISALKNYDGSGVENIGAFAKAAKAVLDQFVDLGAAYEKDATDAAGRFADAAGKALGIIKGGVDGLAALADFHAPAQSALDDFAKTVKQIVESFTAAAATFALGAFDAANDFADTAGKVIKVFKDGIDTFDGLDDFKAPAISSIARFSDTIASVVLAFTSLARGFDKDVFPPANLFADTAGKAVKVIGDGITGLDGLDKFKAPSTSAIARFADTVTDIVLAFTSLASGFSKDAYPPANLFTDTAGKAIQIIGNGVKGLMDLNTFVAPSKQAIDAFTEAVFYTVQRFVELAKHLSTEGLTQANAFSDAAIKALDATKAGTQAFKDFNDLIIPSTTAVDNLLVMVQYVVQKFTDMATALGSDGIAQANQFATTASSVFTALSDAVKLIGSLQDHKDDAVNGLNELKNGIDAAVNKAVELVNSAKDLAKQAADYLSYMQQAQADFATGSSISTPSVGVSSSPAPSQKGYFKVTTSPDVPKMASGGIVTQPTLAMIGEGGEPEAVIPLSRLGNAGKGDTYEFHFHSPVYGVKDMEDAVVSALRQAGKRGRVSVSV